MLHPLASPFTVPAGAQVELAIYNVRYGCIGNAGDLLEGRPEKAKIDKVQGGW